MLLCLIISPQSWQCLNEAEPGITACKPQTYDRSQDAMKVFLEFLNFILIFIFLFKFKQHCRKPSELHQLRMHNQMNMQTIFTALHNKCRINRSCSLTSTNAESIDPTTRGSINSLNFNSIVLYWWFPVNQEAGVSPRHFLSLSTWTTKGLDLGDFWRTQFTGSIRRVTK